MQILAVEEIYRLAADVEPANEALNQATKLAAEAAEAAELAAAKAKQEEDEAEAVRCESQIVTI